MIAASPSPSALPDSSGLRRAGRVVEAYARAYRRTWRASVFSSFLSPVLFLLAMGVGLGQLVDDGSGASTAQLHGVGYLDFIAPALLVAWAMQTAAGESTWPVLGGIKWTRTYHAALATPVSAGDVVLGHLGFVALRLIANASIFLVVITVFGAVASPWGVLVLPAGVLTGLAFAAPITAFAATQDTDRGFAALMRFGIVPMFLFSGTFFPISQLPSGFRVVAVLTPLYHGVDLCRSLALGRAGGLVSLGHVAYLLVWVVGGTVVAHSTFRRRLVA